MTNENTGLQVQVNSGVQVTQGSDGKFKRVQNVEFFSTFTPTTQEEKINLFNLLNTDEIAIPMAKIQGTTIEVKDFLIQPYDSVDEDTGEVTVGGLTYLFAVDGNVYVTSSVSVRHTINRISNIFGYPTENTPFVVQVIEKSSTKSKFKYTDIKLVG